MPHLEIREAPLHVRLGCDEPGDIVCYPKRVEEPLELCARREFRIVEHLASAIARRLRAEVPADARLEVRVTKLHPPIEELEDGVIFSLSL